MSKLPEFWVVNEFLKTPYLCRWLMFQASCFASVIKLMNSWSSSEIYGIILFRGTIEIGFLLMLRVYVLTGWDFLPTRELSGMGPLLVSSPTERLSSNMRPELNSRSLSDSSKASLTASMLASWISSASAFLLMELTSDWTGLSASFGPPSYKPRATFRI